MKNSQNWILDWKLESVKENIWHLGLGFRKILKIIWAKGSTCVHGLFSFHTYAVFIYYLSTDMFQCKCFTLKNSITCRNASIKAKFMFLWNSCKGLHRNYVFPLQWLRFALLHILTSGISSNSGNKYYAITKK